MPFQYTGVVLVLSLVSALLIQAKSVKRTTGQVNIQNGCASSELKFPTDLQSIPDVTIPEMNWIQTPSIVEITKGHYRAQGRVVHMTYLREQLQNQKKLKFTASRDTMDIVPELVILADTVYIKEAVALIGIRTVKIFAREIVGAEGSKIDVSAPNWNDLEGTAPTGTDGVTGDNGENGPRVDILCDVIHGLLEVSSNAGNGRKGQNGGRGALAADSGHTQPAKSSWECSKQGKDCTCNNVAGIPGIDGPIGGRGGNAGRPGNGGNAGNVNIRYRELNGKIKIKSCRGSGAQAAINGVGGRGGAGGRGGLGRNCRADEIIWTDKRSCKEKRGLGRRKRKCGFSRSARTICEWGSTFFCKDNGAGGRAPSGQRGGDGPSGTTPNTPGQDGSVSTSLVQSGALDASHKQSYPAELLDIMRRQAVDLLLGNSDDQKGRQALQFILSVANERSDVDDIKQYVRRKLAFLGQPGYDIFGKNKLFAPRIKWEALEDTVEFIRNAAASYEDAFNDIIATVTNKENFQEMASKMSEVSALQVKAEKGRLEQARLIAESEKRMCIKFIQQQEEMMNGILGEIETKLPYLKAQFNGNDWIALLQGLVGFTKAIKGKSPLDFIDSAITAASTFKSKACLKSMGSYMDDIKKWMTFGENYRPLLNSSELDFDQLDVGSVPEIMQANLEINKEKLTAELVCLLEVASTPQDVAAFKAEIEAFFIRGQARIDLIARVLNLDNEMGGYNFDIPLLEKTEQAITDVSKSPDTPITTTLRQNFLDYLLSTYRALERSFMNNIYEQHKAFAFRTLWEGNNPLASFRRVASESALGTGRLNGVIQLTDVLQRSKQIRDKAVKCFTFNIYTSDIKKWSFDNVKDKPMFDELATNRNTTFSINIDESCDTCYNMRLLAILVELYGPEDQPEIVPATVHLEVRRLSGSYFLAGDGKIKQYRQTLGSFRKIKFDRFSISDDAKCKEKKKEGRKPSIHTYCVTKDDSRLEQMCTNPLNKLGSAKENTLLGMEECRSPFGTYELKIPVDENLACDDPGIMNTNCKDLDLTKFTKMNVWTHFFYWSGQYPTGPDDPICKIPLNKRNETAHLPTAPDDGEQN